MLDPSEGRAPPLPSGDELLRTFFLLPQVAAAPHTVLRFFDEWRALPDRLPDRQRAAAVAAKLAPHVTLSLDETLALKEHLLLLFGPTCLAPTAAAAAPATASAATPAASGLTLTPPGECPLRADGGQHKLGELNALKGQKKLFTMGGVKLTTAYIARCSCGATLHTSTYREPGGTQRFYAHAAARPVFQSSRQIAWDRELLVWLGVLLERSQVAFDGFAIAYAGYLDANGLPGAGERVGKLRPFDYRQAGAAWLQHELLAAQAAAGLPLSSPAALRREDIDAELARVVPDLKEAFGQQWAVRHDDFCPKRRTRSPGTSSCSEGTSRTA